METQIKPRKSVARSIFIVILCVFLTVGAGFFPIVYFHFSDEVWLRTPHPRDNLTAGIDAQTKDIYLLSAIHALYNGDGSSLNTETAAAVFPEAFEKLLDSIGFSSGYDKLLPEEAVYDTGMTGDGDKILHHYITFTFDSTAEDPFLSFQMEEKTGKLIFLGIGKKDLEESMKLPDRQELMDGYLRYLGLDVLSDWKENEIGRMSAKAQMQLYCLINEDALLLCVAPIGFFDNNRLPEILSSFLIWPELLPLEQ